MSKSYLRASKASGTDRAKVELLIRRGWAPGRTFGEVLERRRRPANKGEKPGGQHAK
jgi:hypothetical protein